MHDDAELSRTLRRQVAFLIELGAHRVPHGAGSLLIHLVTTRNVLHQWNAPVAVCTAGLYHSVYGARRWPTALVDDSDAAVVRRVIGARAEALVALYRRVDLYSMEPSVIATGRQLNVSSATGRNLLCLAAANLVAAFPLDNGRMRDATTFLRKAAGFLPDRGVREVRKLTRIPRG